MNHAGEESTSHSSASAAAAAASPGPAPMTDTAGDTLAGASGEGEDELWERNEGDTNGSIQRRDSKPPPSELPGGGLQKKRRVVRKRDKGEQDGAASVPAAGSGGSAGSRSSKSGPINAETATSGAASAREALAGSPADSSPRALLGRTKSVDPTVVSGARHPDKNSARPAA